MKNAMKSYLVFTSRLYRLVMYMLLPGVCGGICLWACGSGGSRAGRGVLMAAALLLPMVETVSDSWLFAGVQNLSYTNLEYLKSSGRGGAVMRQALTVDVVRKLVSSAVILGLAYAIIGLWELLSGEIKEGLWAGAVESAFGFWGAGSGTGGVLWCMVMCSFFFSMLGTFLSRYGNMIWINLMVGYGVVALEIAGQFLPGLSVHLYGYGGIFGLLGLCVGALAVRTAMARMERSYYDQRPFGRGGPGMGEEESGM